jgi:hypothetical protein
MVPSPAGVLTRGLQYLHLDYIQQSEANRNEKFHQHYGSSPLVLATMWHDMAVTTIVAARVSDEELCEKGFRMFLIAHFFLWVYPKNAGLIASRFRICISYSKGERLWLWIQKIAALKELKIRWDPRLNLADAAVFVATVDGIDHRAWERKNPTLNQDPGNCSQKFNHCTFKYEVGLHPYTSNCLWINGPFRGGEHDLTMMRAGRLFELVVAGKKVIADRGYRTGVPEERAKLSLPSEFDSAALNNFKSRARLRHETFNGRLKKYASLSETFRHGFAKHKFIFEAVAVCVQYHMENGSLLYDA